MPLQDSDISWELLRRIVRQWAGDAAELVEVKPLEGGCINTTLLLASATGERAVIKISPHRVNKEFLREAAQLDLLRGVGLPAPRVYDVHAGSLDQPNSYLLMEYKKGVDLARARSICTPTEFDALQADLARLVTHLHDHIGESFCQILPDSPKGNAEHSDKSWPAFYRGVYDPAFYEVEKSGHLPIKMRKLLTRVHQRLERLISHDDVPRLVHWDIWATNILAAPDADGAWRVSAVLDPNCKYAHAEAEIAYMELFKTITPAFMRAYQQRHKLPPEYHRVRRRVYQLYPLLNHVKLFGADYVKPLQDVLGQLAPLL